MHRLPPPGLISNPLRQVRRILRQLRGRRGAGAVEFALVAPVFFLFLGIILDNGLLLFQQAILDSATADAARLIRTGQAQQSADALTTFKTRLCNDLSSFIGCSNIQFNVLSNSSFSALNTTVVSDGHGALKTKDSNGNLIATAFSPGVPSSDVFIQVAWNRPYMVPWVSNMANPHGTQLMVSTIAFRNEIYK